MKGNYTKITDDLMLIKHIIKEDSISIKKVNNMEGSLIISALKKVSELIDISYTLKVKQNNEA